MVYALSWAPERHVSRSAGFSRSTLNALAIDVSIYHLRSLPSLFDRPLYPPSTRASAANLKMVEGMKSHLVLIPHPGW